MRPFRSAAAAVRNETRWWLAAYRSRLRGRPPRTPILVSDLASRDITDPVLVGLDFVVLARRGEATYVNALTILWKIAYTFRLRSSQAAYLASIVRQVSPQVVLTAIDNDLPFHEVAACFPQTVFMAIQNGWRFPDYQVPLPPDRRFASEMYCFGKNEVDSYDRERIRFSVVVPVGSVRDAVYRSSRTEAAGKQQDSRPRFDVCVLSQYAPRSAETPIFDDIRRLYDLLAQYMAARPEVTVAVAGRTLAGQSTAEAAGEEEYFERLFGGRATFIPRSTPFATYELVDECHVNVSCISTASLEGLGRGAKSLMCVPSGRLAMDGPMAFPWLVGAVQQPEFDELLDRLIRLPPEDFLAESKDIRRYAVSMPSEAAADEVVRARVRMALQR